MSCQFVDNGCGVWYNNRLEKYNRVTEPKENQDERFFESMGRI